MTKKKPPFRSRLNAYLMQYFHPAISDFLIYFFKKKTHLPPKAIKAINASAGVFVRIPKTATESICKALGDPGYQHRSIHFYRYHPDLNKALPSFTVVRNPWDRFVSAFEFAKKNPDIGNKSVQEFLNSFADIQSFIHACKKDKLIYRLRSHHFIPQYKFISALNGTIGVDHVLHFETLQADFTKLCQSLGIAEISLPHINKTSHAKYQDYYSPETRDIVGQLYKKDIELFGYEF